MGAAGALMEDEAGEAEDADAEPEADAAMSGLAIIETTCAEA